MLRCGHVAVSTDTTLLFHYASSPNVYWSDLTEIRFGRRRRADQT